MVKIERQGRKPQKKGERSQGGFPQWGRARDQGEVLGGTGLLFEVGAGTQVDSLCENGLSHQ